jgi:hypothetical protein
MVADAIDTQSALGLEHLHCCCGPWTVSAGLVVSASESKPLEALLQVNDGLARVALVKWQEIFAGRCRPRTAHKPDLSGTSVISDIVGEPGKPW